MVTHKNMLPEVFSRINLDLTIGFVLILGFYRVWVLGLFSVGWWGGDGDGGIRAAIARE